MPNLSDITVPYEILIRFDSSGALQGAHKVTRRIVMLDDEILKDEVGMAQPLSTEDAAAEGLWNVLDQALVAALATVVSQEQQIAALQAHTAAAQET